MPEQTHSVTDSDPALASLQRHRDGPGWRWLKAEQAAESGTRRGWSGLDPWTKAAAAYLRQRDRRLAPKDDRELARVAAAVQIEAHIGQRETLQILTLGDVAPATIAELSGLAAEDVEWWEALFFDVRSQRRHPAWIRSHVTRPLEEAGRGPLAARLKVALAGGAEMAVQVIEADVRIPLEAAERIADAELKLHQKLVEAVDIPLVGSAEAVELLLAYEEYRLRRQQLEFEREQFRERCLAARRQHELAVKLLDGETLEANTDVG